jgi:hypothetical protein
MLLLAACSETSQGDAVAAADDFFQLVREGRNRKAFDSTAFGFQAQASFEGFEATLADLGLRNFVSCTWTRKVIKNDDAKLDGEIVKATNAKVLVALELVREGGAWKLYSLRTPQKEDLVFTENKFSLLGRTVAFADEATRPVPGEAELQQMVKEAMLKFNAAVQMQNFSEFYNYVSVAWQSQLLERQLKRAFQGFIDARMDIGQVRDAVAVFEEPPALNSKGILTVKGYYPTEPLRVTFLLKFIYELPKWRLFGVEVSVIQPREGPEFRGAPRLPAP